MVKIMTILEIFHHLVVKMPGKWRNTTIGLGRKCCYCDKYIGPTSWSSNGVRIAVGKYSHVTCKLTVEKDVVTNDRKIKDVH